MSVSYILQNKEIQPLWLVLAKDSFVLRENKAYIKKICTVNGIDDDSISTFEVGKSDWTEVYDSVEMPSFFGDRLIFIESDDITQINDDDFEKVCRLCESLEFNHLALIFRYDDDKKIKTKKYDKFFSIINGKGIVHQVKEIDENYLEEMIIRRAKENKTIFPKALARKTVENIGKDAGLLISETDKYCAACNYTEITEPILDEIGVRSVEASVFDMIDLICRNNSSKAVEKLNNLFARRTDEFAVLGALTTTFIDMHRCKIAKKNGLGYSQVNSDFESKSNSYRYQKASRNSDNFSLLSLESILEMLMNTDISMKTSAQDKKQQIYVLLAQIISKVSR